MKNGLKVDSNKKYNRLRVIHVLYRLIILYWANMSNNY